MEKQELMAHEVIAKVFQIKNEIENRPVSDWAIDSLVDYIFTLTKLMYNLSDLRLDLILASDIAEEDYKSKLRQHYLELKGGEVKMTEVEAKARSEEACSPLKRDEIQARYNARLVSDLYRDSERLINFTQTKIKSMTNEIVRSKMERK